ncbi:MAG: NUDIX hydrolase [Myxococcota bacterium]
MRDWKLPGTRVELEEDLTPGQPAGFLRLRRRKLRNHYDDGTTSASYVYDCVERRALDAVVLVLHSAAGEVCLRSSLRPPVAFRAGAMLDADVAPVLWELPAGLIEPEDGVAEQALRECAARETLEETGLRVGPADFEPLGAPVFLSPGVIAERLYYFRAEVDPAERGVPTEDGTPVEEQAKVRFVAMSEALEACERGLIGDVKSEAGLRRLAAWWAR